MLGVVLNVQTHRLCKSIDKTYKSSNQTNPSMEKGNQAQTHTPNQGAHFLQLIAAEKKGKSVLFDGM